MCILQCGRRRPDERGFVRHRGRLIELAGSGCLHGFAQQATGLGHEPLAPFHSIGMLRFEPDEPREMKSGLSKIASLNRWLDQRVDDSTQFGRTFLPVLSHGGVTHLWIFGIDGLFDSSVYLFEQHERRFGFTARQLALRIQQQKTIQPLVGTEPTGSATIQHQDQFVGVFQFPLVEQQVDALQCDILEVNDVADVPNDVEQIGSVVLVLRNFRGVRQLDFDALQLLEHFCRVNDGGF